MSEEEINTLLSQLRKPLFGVRQDSPSRANDASMRWAITVNIQPTKKMNGRQWKLYSAEKQTAQLSRIEAALRKKTPSIKLIELHYETCPVLKNIHFHALYEMPEEFKSELECYYKRICDSSDDKTLVPWRYLDISPIKNEQAWLDYIRKDL